MNFLVVILLVVIGTAIGVVAGVAFTLRGFRASEGSEKEVNHAAEPAHGVIAPHDHATTELLKRFFAGKECAICNRPIPAVRRGLRPGLWNPKTHETHSWDEIPNDNLAATLETELPVCSDCQIAESFRHRYPDRVVDRHRSSQNAHPHDRIGAGS